MNGVFDKQTSGNEWAPTIPAMLHQQQQEKLPEDLPRQQNLLFENLERQMAAYEVEYQAMIAEVVRSYVMPRNDSVLNFLSTHRSIASLLLQALPRLQQYLPETIFALRASADDDGWQTLCVDAIWRGNARDAFAGLDRFEDAWWVANSHMGAGHLIFTYRLV